MSGLAEASVTIALLNGGSEFFAPVEKGFTHRCRTLGITCYTATSNGSDCVDERSNYISNWIEMGVQGIALKPCNLDHPMMKMYDDALAQGVYITTFDSDTANSSRAAYVGTDNDFMGRTMAKLLRQLRPEGGTFASLAAKEPRTSAFIEEITRYNDKEGVAHWYPAIGTDLDSLYTSPPGYDFMPAMEHAASLNVTAMIFFKQSPMRHENYTKIVDKHRHRGITYIGTDGADYQLAYLNSRYVDGLVGQLPFEMGTESAQVLFNVVTKGRLEKDFYATNIVAYNLIPLKLPELDVDENLIGNMRIVGYICFGIVTISVLFCILWTYRFRNTLIVRAAQPFFLVMISVGVLIMTGSLIPLTFDDGGAMKTMSQTQSVGICMSVPWLGFTGFTVTFSALFSKLWRVNRLFKARHANRRIKVTVIDVIAPFVILLSANILVLTLWTVQDPLMYKRVENTGTDYWNRVISTYGYCSSENAFAYLVPLALINLFVVLIACWQAIKARGIQLEFSEAKYIGFAVGGLLQAFLTGIPVVVVVRDEPQAFFLVLTMVIFLLSEVVLLLIFLPKVILNRRYMGMDEEQQKRMLEQTIREAAGSRVGARSLSSGISHFSVSAGDRVAFLSRNMINSGQSTVTDRLPSVDEIEEVHIGVISQMEALPTMEEEEKLNQNQELGPSDDHVGTHLCSESKNSTSDQTQDSSSGKVIKGTEDSASTAMSLENDGNVPSDPAKTIEIYSIDESLCTEQN